MSRVDIINAAKIQFDKAQRIVKSDSPIKQARLELGRETITYNYLGYGRYITKTVLRYSYEDCRKAVSAAKKIIKKGTSYYIDNGMVCCATLTMGSGGFCPMFGYDREGSYKTTRCLP